jgi:hypothetical protein
MANVVDLDGVWDDVWVGTKPRPETPRRPGVARVPADRMLTGPTLVPLGINDLSLIVSLASEGWCLPADPSK